MDLVDEQHVAVLEIGQQRGQVAGPGQDGTGGDAETGAHLGGHDPGQRRLAQSRRSGEEDVVHGLAPLAGRLQHDPQVLDQLWLPDELRERPGPQPDLLGLLGAAGRHRIDDPATISDGWPTGSPPCGRSAITAAAPAPEPRRGSGSTARTSRRARGLTGSPRRPARATPGGASLPPRHRRVARRAHRGSRRGRSRARSAPPAPRTGTSAKSRQDPPPAAPADAPTPPTPDPGSDRSGRSSRLFNSISSRAAVLRPTPGTVHRVSRSSSSTAVDNAAGDSAAMMASASAGPTPCEPSRTSKQRRSSSCTNPYSTMASSRTWVCTYSVASAVAPATTSAAAVAGVTATR